MTGYSMVGGRKVPNTVITSDQSLDGIHKTGFEVIGCTVVINGTLQGSLSMAGGATVIVKGNNQGSISVSDRGTLRIFGKCQGSVSVSKNSTVVVEREGTFSGSIHNDGTLIIRGGFGGASSGTGTQSVEDDGYIKQPRIENGISHYDW